MFVHPARRLLANGSFEYLKSSQANFSLLASRAHPVLFGAVREGSATCAADIIAGQGLRLACPDNADVVYWLDFAIQDARSIRILTQVYTDNWVDGRPRIGIDVGTGFGAWGPNPGYAFYLSDPPR
jgi:hypothetical protein